MELVADANVFLSVALNEADREWIIDATSACSIIAPEVVRYEIGNALIAVHRRGRLNDREIMRAFDISQKIPVRLVPVKIPDAMKIALQFKLYAYDAYYVQCCIENKSPLISLDSRMCDVAKALGIKVME